MLRRTFFACLTAVAFCIGTPVPAQNLPAVEAFGRLPLTSDPKLSPDGKHFALIRSVNGRPAVTIYSTSPEAGSKPAFVSSSEGIIENVMWAKNDRVIIIAKQGLTETFDRLRTWRRAFAVDVDGGKIVKLIRNLGTLAINVNAANVLDVNLDDSDNIYMGLYAGFGTPTYDIVKVDVHTGRANPFKMGNENTTNWLSDGHGTPVVRVDEHDNPLREHVIVNQNDRWKEIGKFDATEDKGSGIVGLNEDGSALVQMLYNGQAYAALTQYSLATAQTSPLFEVKGSDVAGAIVDEWTGRVIGASYIGDKLEQRYFDAQRQALQKGVEDAFPGMSVRIVSWDLAKDKVVLGVEGPRRPEQYYLLDRTTHQTQLMSDTYPGLNDTNLGEMKPFTYKARDGLEIPAYITLPPNKPVKDLPVVVMPHGGPDVRDFIRFDWMAQFLANRGYVVLQPNFRGSSGYGHKYTELGLRQWGLKMQDDITDGVRKLIIDGIADPKRICIVGGSYGGYAALAGAAFTPGLYACAVSWAGVTDLPLQLGTDIRYAGGSHSQTASFWKSRMGENMAQLAATSPARNADKVKSPILLLHGKNDTTVELKQSQLMADALMQAGKPVEFVTFEGEDHHLELADTRVRVLKEMERFLKQHIGN